MAISALPTPPARSDAPATFISRADAFLAALPTFRTETNSLATTVEGYKTDAATSATASANSATASANSATASATSATESAASATAAANNSSAAKWVSGTTYAEGAVVWAPANYLAYRRKSAGGGTTDPSADPDKWAALTGTASPGSSLYLFNNFGGF